MLYLLQCKQSMHHKYVTVTFTLGEPSLCRMHNWKVVRHMDTAALSLAQGLVTSLLSTP